ncbi:MAG: xanthine dehydrogenase accessory protein XdhC [Phyllobacteriaceae bacterium]|nr:xanthine dehydrogenase accessory protein XdhC [Phyllobacteriaceae bacterium]
MPSRPLVRLQAFFDAHPRAVLVRVDAAKGSTPREAGAWMLVSPAAILGTIGGGQMEFMAIDRARRILSGDAAEGSLDIPLGPEIGQCCGGRVRLDLRLADASIRLEIEDVARGEAETRPTVFVFGAGHVGSALAAALLPLPVHVTVVETRDLVLDALPAGVAKMRAAVPEKAVRDAPGGSAFVVLTHDHALDFLIVGEALRRADAAYVGMIGSATKRETFRRWWLGEAAGDAAALAHLHCPLGGTTADKRPAVIAALTAAEIVTALAGSVPPG